MAFRQRYHTIALALLIILTACGGNSVTTATGQAPIPASPAAEPTPTDLATPSPPHPSGCMGEASPYSISALYVLPQDGIDRGLHTSAAVQQSIGVMQNWFKQQTGGSCLRFDHHASNYSVGFVRLPQSDADLQAAGPFVITKVEAQLKALGHNDPRKLYAVYYDGSSDTSCGAGAWPPTTIGHVAILYLQGQPTEPPSSSPCNIFRLAAAGSAPGFLEFIMLHEILHTLGLVGQCAPNQALEGHVTDSTADLMWGGSGPWKPSTLDVGHDDYYRHGRSDCPDLARSAFLDPLPVSPEAPARWPQPVS